MSRAASSTRAAARPAPAELLAAALSYRERGLSVFPTRGKQPAIRSWKPYAATQPSEAEIRDWFGATNVSGVAVICGPISGDLVCRDFDEPESYERWAIEQPEIADVFPTVRTGRGWHVYFTGDLDAISRACGTRCCKTLGDGELRFSGVYCLLPPSLHPSGRRYEWHIPLPEGPIPRADPFAVGLIQATSRRTESAASAEMAHAISVLSVRTVEELIERTLPEAPGQRNRRLLDLARGLKFNLGYAVRTLEELRPIVREFHRRASPIVTTKDFDETWFDFTHAFERARHPLGDLLAEAIDRADEAPVPDMASRYDSASTRRLVAVCAQMQSLVGGRAFSLSCSQAARVLFGECEERGEWAKRRSRAHRVLAGLERDGVLRCTDRARPGPPGSEAGRYRYLGDVP